jgi:hypothetical protein
MVARTDRRMFNITNLPVTGTPLLSCPLISPAILPHKTRVVFDQTFKEEKHYEKICQS